MRTIALRVEYDGAQFHGFQRQRDPSLPTVGGLLEQIMSSVLDEPVEVVCAGRTDTGVHAVGQVVHVKTGSTRPLEVITRALWRLGHGRLAVPQAWEAPEWFHARHSAARRVYQYHILAAPQPSPLLASRAWHVYGPLDVARMQHEAVSLLGRRDFRAFQGGGRFDHYFRTMYRLEVRAAGAACGGGSYLRDAVARAPLVCIEVEADAFLPHMVRMLVGTLVDVGTGNRPAGTASMVLRSRDPRLSSAAAPPQALCLVRVVYPPSCGVPQEGPT